MKHAQSIVLALCLAAGSALAATLEEQARQFQTQLKDQVMPYWHDTSVDPAGGYLMADDARGRGRATEKQLVSQSRMIWGFAHAHLQGLSTEKRNYLKDAESGYKFLLDHFLDRQNGGYYWRTDLAGKPTFERKIMYGQSFVLYGLVEYYRASGDRQALQHAMDLFRVIQQRAHDTNHLGWIEHFTRDWQPILKHDRDVQVEIGGYKSANTHLHLMESLAELCEASKDAEVKKALAESLKLNMTYFYPAQAGKSAFHRQLDWQPVTDPQSAGLSYGHNVEFAWLMLRAQNVLGEKPAWDHFYAHIDHALKYGFDWERGGLYARGEDDQPATHTEKVWWAEAELIAALTDALKHQANPRYADALRKQVEFLQKYQINAADGIWFDTMTADGRIQSGGKAHSWKANYHDVRAMVKFGNAFGSKN
jgi:mannobiose 2-epimerase